MERGYRDAGRSSLGGAGLDDYRSYGRSGWSGYLDYDLPMRDSYLDGLGSSSYRSGRCRYGAGSSIYDRERDDIMESLLQQRALQQQLSLGESQLALASSLLQQQQQQEFLNKRRMSPRGRDSRQDFKQPRLMDVHPRPRNQSTGGQDSRARGRGNMRGGSSNRRNQRTARWREQLSSERSKSKDDSEKPTADEDGEESKNRCNPCGVQCKDFEELKKHFASNEHKERKKRLYCHVCDVAITHVSLLTHQRFPFHKKRKKQVLRGCGWCKITSFNNFTEVLEHRDTEKHKKNQEKRKKQAGGSDSRRSSRGGGRSRREREPIKVELPPELAKFDPKVVVGQICVVGVTGWFCKLCNKFYSNENTAKETHCMTERHFNNYKKFMYAKLKAEAERDAREKAAEEERKKKETEEKKAEGDKGEPTSEQAEGDPKETTDREGEEQEGEEAMEQTDAAEEEAGAEGWETVVKKEEAVMDEEEGEEMIGEPEEYVDDEEAAAAEEEGLFEQTQEGGENLTGTGDVGNEGAVHEEDPQAEEEPMEAEAEEEEQEAA